MTDKTAGISQTAQASDAFLRPFGYFERARDAFTAVLEAEGIGKGARVLLPAYIGFSPNEGSGVFDPISARGIEPVFYRMDEGLQIDAEDLRRKLPTARALVIIHYFGFPDPCAREICREARAMGCVVIEDAAHAMYSDLVGRVCGRDGDYTLYSLHKMLPFSAGGMLTCGFGRRLPKSVAGVCRFGSPFDYDLSEIAARRRENYMEIARLLPQCADVMPLRPVLYAGVVPQTFPVILKGIDRNRVYAEMNRRGWGLVSLYHTMIPQLRGDGYPEARAISAQITNLPVHQDVERSLIAPMLSDFMEVTAKERL